MLLIVVFPPFLFLSESYIYIIVTENTLLLLQTAASIKLVVKAFFVVVIGDLNDLSLSHYVKFRFEKMNLFAAISSLALLHL